jgi:YVTN family beta-propeller protein
MSLRHAARTNFVPLLALLAAAPTARAQTVCNAPIAPDTIYVARSGGNPHAAGLSVIDLNGFGQSTGDPAHDPTYQQFPPGSSNFPNNPNVKLQGSLLFPPLAPGLTSRTGGSAGVFTLTRNSALDTMLVRSPAVQGAGDMMLGWPLDVALNNGPVPFGCQAGGGNLCLIDALQQLRVVMGGPNTLAIAGTTAIPFYSITGGGNPISFAPHPNPPPLLDTPVCANPLIFGQEPTSSITPLANLLAPGDWQGDPLNGIPPSGLLTLEQNTGFLGTGHPSPIIAQCTSYVMRQQLGHFLYLVDSVADQVVVLNSNTFEVITRIGTPDPTELAMSPNLSLLAVTNRAAGSVSFIDIDPHSSTFHSIVATTTVGNLPSGIAWDPGNEDVLVCNEGSNSVSIISAASLVVRKTVTTGLAGPFAVAITQRQANFGYMRNVYFGYVLDRAGRVSVFESGPNTINGWGYDDIIGQIPFVFANPQAIQPDPLRLESGVWIAHEGQLDADGHPTALTGGAVTNVRLLVGARGAIPLNFMSLLTPQFRLMRYEVLASIGTDQLTGSPLDIAFDNQRNLGSLPNVQSSFGSGAPAPTNGKSQVRQTPGGIANVNEATYMFLPVREAATGLVANVDVIRLSTKQRVDTDAYQAGVQSIPARGAAVVMDYFRQ